MADTFKTERIPSTFHWRFSPQGQHMELGIAEMNLFTMLSALGLSHSIHGERLLPIGTLYDPFIERGLDALNYACYQDARFILVATPSGISLAGEGGAHQSIATPLIGMAQDGLTSFEPAHVDELAAILRWSFDHMQRPAGNTADAGGSVYLRLSTRTLAQPARHLSPVDVQDITDGAYWMRRPGPNAETVIAYTGAVAPEAVEAAGLIGEDRRDIGLLAVTSADRLHNGWVTAQRAREQKADTAMPYRAVADGPASALQLGYRARRPSGDLGLARRGSWPSYPGTGRHPVRADRHDRRPVPHSRHRRTGDRGRGRFRAGPSYPLPTVVDGGSRTHPIISPTSPGEFMGCVRRGLATRPS